MYVLGIWMFLVSKFITTEKICPHSVMFCLLEKCLNLSQIVEKLKPVTVTEAAYLVPVSLSEGQSATFSR